MAESRRARSEQAPGQPDSSIDWVAVDTKPLEEVFALYGESPTYHAALEYKQYLQLGPPIGWDSVEGKSPEEIYALYGERHIFVAGLARNQYKPQFSLLERRNQGNLFDRVGLGGLMKNIKLRRSPEQKRAKRFNKRRNTRKKIT